MEPETYCDRLARLAVEVGANVQEDQIVALAYAPGMEPLARAVARMSYERGARFVDPFVFDGHIRRIRLETAREETLDFVPEWWGRRVLALGESNAARIWTRTQPATSRSETLTATRSASRCRRRRDRRRSRPAIRP